MYCTILKTCTHWTSMTSENIWTSFQTLSRHRWNQSLSTYLTKIHFPTIWKRFSKTYNWCRRSFEWFLSFFRGGWCYARIATAPHHVTSMRTTSIYLLLLFICIIHYYLYHIICLLIISPNLKIILCCLMKDDTQLTIVSHLVTLASICQYLPTLISILAGINKHWMALDDIS